MHVAKLFPILTFIIVTHFTKVVKGKTTATFITFVNVLNVRKVITVVTCITITNTINVTPFKKVARRRSDAF